MTLEKSTQPNYQKQTFGHSGSLVKIYLSPENKKALLANAAAYSLQLPESFVNSKTSRNLAIYSLKTLKTFYQLMADEILENFKLSWTKSGMTSNGTFWTRRRSCLSTGSASILSDILEDEVPEGITGTLNTMSGGNREPKILVKEATKRGYAEGYEGDSVNISQPNSKTRRGIVGKQVANTLETGINQGVVTEELFIRKLTPLECWRLQGFADEQFYKAKAVNSNSQLYKQVGNSVSVPVVYAVASRL